MVCGAETRDQLIGTENTVKGKGGTLRFRPYMPFFRV
jgi:hypothetical protein